MYFLKTGHLSQCVLLCIISIGASSQGDDILGCNGFIKSDIGIDFSKIEIKLMTKQGTMKDQTECAPNNGYYFLPLYDKGEYVLKVSAPAGWTFEPSEFILNADGVTDHCSLNKDINFEFKGFSVHGKVTGVGHQKGPIGVKVVLNSTSSGKSMETISGQDGFFQFKPVLPSSYILEASHPKWRFQKSQVKVEVLADNAEVPLGSLVISGFDVTGFITSDNEPIPDVHFVVYTENSNKADIFGCGTDKLNTYVSPSTVKDKKALCHVSSDSEGKFVFPSLSPGQYILVPFYKRESNAKFDIQPSTMIINVAQDSIILDNVFQIMGFSVLGRVLSSKDSAPVTNANIYLDDRDVTRSSTNGQFILENVKTGTYKLGIKTDTMRFNDIVVKASPSATQLDPIYPSAYKVCGTVQPSSSGTIEPPRLVVFTSKSANGDVVFEETWSKEATGEFCLFLSPGRYHASISINDLDKQKGLQFAPLKREVIVKDSIVNNINFSQLKAELKGTIQCLNPKSCSNFVLHLRNTANDQVIHDVVVKDGVYSVSNIMPGEYEVILQNSAEWCWESEIVRVTIDSLVAQAPPLNQTGVSVSFTSSHSTKVKYTTDTKNPNEIVNGEIDLSEGVTSTCVPKDVTYIFTPVGCHGYADSKFKWKSGQGSVTLSATTHKLTTKIVTDKPADDIYANVMNSQNKLGKRFGPLSLSKSSPSTNSYTYEFDLQLSPHEQITVVPSASLLLFTPISISYIGHTDCHIAHEYFTAETGKLILGSIRPPFSDVTVNLTNEAGVTVEQYTTYQNGKYKFGPVKMNEKYQVSAEKEGYVLTGPDSNGIFKAHKLAEVQVEIHDESDKSPLLGVLISLSGGKSYRRNAQTGQDGKVSFLGLSPNEYYLRPMMKEYKFTPSSQIINVSEAATAQVRWSGERIAYSVIGSVTSLNGEAEPGITVEAVGVPDSGLDCDKLQEESITELNGQFRIRGLKPQCDYSVRIKQSSDVNQHIERAAPDSIPVKVSKKDITLSKRFIAFRPITRCDLTLFIESKHLKTLTINLYKSNHIDTPMYTMKLSKALTTLSDTSVILPFHHLPLIEGIKTGYTVIIETTLNKNIYDLSSVKLVQEFVADSSYKLLIFNINPNLVSMNEHVMDLNNFIVIILFLCVFLALYNYKSLHIYIEKVQTFLQNIREKHETMEKDFNKENDNSVLMQAIPVGMIRRKTKPKKIS